MKTDLHGYHRRIKIFSFFKDRDSSVPLPFMPKSTWSPAEGQVPEQILQLIQKDNDFFHSRFKLSKLPQNLTHIELKALQQLRGNKDIIIKPADKGSAVVIMDRFQYLWEAHRQLTDTRYYKPLKRPIFPRTASMVKKIIDNLYQKKIISFKQSTYLLGRQPPRPRRFYLLPKIHKDPDTWSVPFCIPPGRPIVSDCNSETYQIAEFIDYYLNPLSTKHPSYLKDTYDFISKIHQLIIPEPCFLYTMDVNNLYTNIDTAEGLESIKDIFSKHPDPHRPDSAILQLLYISLTRNNFEFNQQFYLQVKGTAMGKKFAPAYANIFMAAWEEQVWTRTGTHPLHYFRYLDDIWGVWTESKTSFDNWVESVNNINPSITLKATIHEQQVDFLDTTTFKGNQFHITHKLEIKVFFKPTDTHALLFKTSHHPKHTFLGIIKSQLLRFHRICSRGEDFQEATRVLFRALARRGYSRSIRRRADKTYLDTRTTINSSTLLPLILDYSTSTLQFTRTIKRHLATTQEQLQDLKQYKLIAAFRKGKNLRDLLVRSTVPPAVDQPRGKKKQLLKQNG